MLLVTASSAVAHHPSAGKTRALDAAPWITDGLHTPGTARLTGRSAFSGAAAPGQHGAISQHLPAASENIELVSKLELNTPVQYRFDPTTGDPDPTEPPIVEGQIADLAVYKNAAYLAPGASRRASAAGSSRSTSPTPRTRASSRLCRPCRRPTTARARTW